jgi:hypothetical protein
MPETREVTTLAELFDLTTEANVDEMIENVTQLLMLAALAKTCGQDVVLTKLTWVDDGKPGILRVNLDA